MNVIGKCRVTRVWEKLIEIRNDDSFILVALSFFCCCCGIQYVVVQVNQFLINSIDAKFSVTKVIVLSRNLSITSKDKIDLQNSRVYKNSGSSCSCLCICNFLSNSDTFGIRNLIFTFFYLNLNYLDQCPAKLVCFHKN